ncbi:unnamed protein product [Adineta ricciae]|uniref:AIG1-type G domain-containing protein n=1 Tax=Adineta ricciae TaxID=249248 RepID=A0A814E946_ADIRI|nr:unnamed protein product [Adineta ricciae]CAF1470141.1 unnamed protein product [Adineta ricciae]
MARNYDNKFGLIILGNSGVGKSFLANILLGREEFKHEFSGQSVTHRTEYQEITIDNNDYAIFNIPGLIEADQSRVNINKREIDYAFQQRPNSLIIYVFGHQFGRIRNEDVVAFNAINEAYPLNPESLLMVVNALPANRSTNYEGEVILMVQDIIARQVSERRMCFLNHINPQNIEERVALRNQFLGAIFELSPREHRKEHDIHLQADEVAMLKQQIQNMKDAFDQNKTEFQNEIRIQQLRYDDLVIQQKMESERFQRIIDQQAEEAIAMRERQTEQVRQMQERLVRMQADHQTMIQEMTNKNNADTALIRQALEQSNQAQAQLRQQITDLTKRSPQVVYRTAEEGGGKHGCAIL